MCMRVCVSLYKLPTLPEGDWRGILLEILFLLVTALESLLIDYYLAEVMCCYGEAP